MKMLSGNFFAAKACAFSLLILVVVACGGGLPQSLTKDPSFVAVNYYDDSIAHVDILAETTPESLVGSNLGFGDVSSVVTGITDTANVTVNARLTGTTVNFATSNHTIANYNVIVAFGELGDAVVKPYPLIEQEKPFIKVIHANHIQTSGYDIYVTAPGADLASLEPDYKNLDYSRAADLQDSVHVGANFQVRLCTAGTKNVTAIFNQVASAEGGTSYVFVAGLGGATTDVAQFTVDTSDSP